MGTPSSSISTCRGRPPRRAPRRHEDPGRGPGGGGRLAGRTTEAVELLRALLRIDTTNAPDRPANETEAATFLADLLAQEGLEPELLESKRARGMSSAAQGRRQRGPAHPPAGHLDVVPADAARWTHPPSPRSCTVAGSGAAVPST